MSPPAALGTLQEELGALQAGQAAERGQLERALATARDEVATWQREATRLRDEVAAVRGEVATWQREVATWQREVATLQREVATRRELGARWEVEATGSHGKEQRWQEATTEVARMRGTGTGTGTGWGTWRRFGSQGGEGGGQGTVGR